jgi:hypothetical protein
MKINPQTRSLAHKVQPAGVMDFVDFEEAERP